MEAESYVDKYGEWRTKKVSIMGVVQSFVSQLRVGQDLTRVALPSILLYPFSMLEVFASRELSTFDLLLHVNEIGNPLDRMIAIVAWFLSTLPMEVWRKKPYNPVIGEVHECHIESNNRGNTFFVAEQVSHHPPVSSIFVHNPKEQVSLSENLSFGVTFGGNSLNIITLGSSDIVFDKLKEKYEFPKKVPDMSIKHLILGTKKIFWQGDITINCPETGLITILNFNKDGDKSGVKGHIFQKGKEKEALVTFDGHCGGTFYFAHGKEKKKVLIDVEKITKAKIHYQHIDELDPMSSMKVWANVSKFILEDKVAEADEAKKKVEEDQRKRILEEGQGPHQAKYFKQPFPSLIQSSSASSSSSNAPVTQTNSASASASTPAQWEIKESIFNSAKLGRPSHDPKSEH